MSVRAMALVWERSKAKGSELLLLLAIADYAKDDGSDAWPSFAVLAQKSRMTERAVRIILQRLEKAGELTVQRNSEGREVGDASFQPRYFYTVCCVKTFQSENFSLIGRSQKSERAIKSPCPPIKEDPSVDPLLPHTRGKALTASDLQKVWNDGRGSLPACDVLNEKREREAGRRLAEVRSFLKSSGGGDERAFWASVVKALSSNPWYCGQSPGGWRADFDYFVRAGIWIKAKEGHFAPGSNGGRGGGKRSAREETRGANVKHVAQEGFYEPPADDDDDPAKGAAAGVH